ncbi:MAG: tryptophan-rich sensory protein [Lachnospiraceae bacterium]|nr:tryptophan-rich sensory protein [Lachnospiraceae bacterium]
MKVNWKALIISILIPLATGALAGFLTMGGMESYASMNQPPLSPPVWLFPIVWTVLYILMGVSSYLIYVSEADSKSQALTTYIYQLIVNFLWPVFFFNFQWYFFSFLWLALLWILVAKMILEFGQISKIAAILNVPYLLWLSFAGYLNLGVWLLN